MSRHSILMTAPLLLTVGLIAGLFGSDAAAIDVEDGVPFAAAEPTLLQYPAGSLDAKIPIEVRTRRQGVVYSHEGECQAKLVAQNPPLRKLVCPGIGSVMLETVEQEPAQLTLTADLRGFQLAPGVDGELRGAVLGHDEPLSNPIRVERNWLWGVDCILEASDVSACSNDCAAIGYEDSRVIGYANHMVGQCQAICTCFGADGLARATMIVAAAPF